MAVPYPFQCIAQQHSLTTSVQPYEPQEDWDPEIEQHDPLSFDSEYSSSSEEYDVDDMDIEDEESDELLDNMPDEDQPTDSARREELTRMAEGVALAHVDAMKTDMQRFRLGTTPAGEDTNKRVILLSDESVATPFFPKENEKSEDIFAGVYSKVGISHGVHTWKIRVIQSPDECPTLFYGAVGTWQDTETLEQDRHQYMGCFFSTFGWLTDNWGPFSIDHKIKYTKGSSPNQRFYPSTQVSTDQIIEVTINADNATFTAKVADLPLCPPVPLPECLVRPFYLCVLMVHEGTVVQLV